MADSEQAQHTNEIEVERQQAEVRERAQLIWDGASPAVHRNPYCVLLGLNEAGLKVYRGPLAIDGDRCDDSLLVPMRDAERTIQNVGFITALNTIRFLPGGQVAWTYYGWGSDRQVIVVCRGISIAAKVHAATGHSVAVAFTADNLQNVVNIMRGRYPQARVVLAADLVTSPRGADQMNAVAPPALPAPAAGDTSHAPPNGSQTVADSERPGDETHPPTAAPSEALVGSASDRAAELDRELLTDHPDAKKLLGWIERKRLAEFTRSQVLQFGPVSVRNAEAAKTALHTLVEHGWVTTEDGTRYRVPAAALAPSEDRPASRRT